MSAHSAEQEPVAARAYDAALHLLDRQVLDVDGQPACNVDDLELAEQADGTLVVTGLLVGPGALGRRLPGRLGRWTLAVWRRLHPDPDPQPGLIAMTDITAIGSAVRVRRSRTDLPGQGMERWLDAHVIGRIPGASHDPE